MNDTHQEQYATLTFAVQLARPVSFFLWKLFFPFIVIVLSGVSFTFLPVSELSSRLYLPVYSILTIVFLQMAYSVIIPETGYLVTMDRIYVAAYAFCAFSIGQIVFISWVAARQGVDIEKLTRIDHLATVLSTLAFVFYIAADAFLSYHD